VKGTSSLVKNTLSGVFNSLNKMSGSMAKGMSALT